MTTGNGFGFQLYDTNANKIDTFLQHPYRYLGPGATPMDDGVVRRQLAYDFYFGLRTPTSSGWLNAGTQAADPSYLDDSHIIYAPMTFSGVTADAYYFAPFDYPGNALIALLHAPGASNAFVLFNFHMGTGDPDMPDANGESLSAGADGVSVIETGPGGGAMVYVPLSGLDHADCTNVFNVVNMGTNLGNNRTCAGDDIVPAFQKAFQPADNSWFAVAVLYVDDPTTANTVAAAVTQWAAGRTPDKILADSRAEFEGWRKPPPAQAALSAQELPMWRQSEAVLRMGQIREPTTSTSKNTGMILASLPQGQWHTGWVRDGQYATVALSRSGHYAEAKASLDFFLNAGPVGGYMSYVNNQDYRISVVRYFGNGAEQADYSGQPTPNVELDGWGSFLWDARQYVDASGDVAWLSSMTAAGDTVYDTLVSGVATPLQNNLESSGIVAADSSIWEVHEGNKRHFAYTTLAAIRGFCDMATLAERAGKTADVAKYRMLSNQVANGFYAAFLDKQGAIAGSIEGLQQGVYTDASVVEAFTWDILPSYTGNTATQTLDLLGNLSVQSGGFKRNDNNMSDYDNNEWILIDLRMSDAYRRAGQTANADKILQLVEDKVSANFNLLPELFNAVQGEGAIGIYTGSIPMVGYGGGMFLMTILDRAGLIEPNDCGQSTLTDGGVTVSGDAGRPGSTGPGGGSASPYMTACLCQTGRGAPAPSPGTAALLALPWLLCFLRLGLRSRRRASIA